eukprot:g8567.t1
MRIMERYSLARQDKIERMLRVDYAGECGAQSIYRGQLWGLRDEKIRPLIQEMLDQEDKHAEAFEQRMKDNQVRPSILMPLWGVCGFALGAITARLGQATTMACTAAVEEVIESHYAGQEEVLSTFDDPASKELKDFLAQCREEEGQHKDLGLEHGAQEAPAFVHEAIKGVTRAAIWLSERF